VIGQGKGEGSARGLGVVRALTDAVRRRKYARLLRASGLVAPEFYCAQCPDEPAARRDPVGHYLARGAARGLDPNPFFDTRFYLERYPDVAGAGKNPLIHYLRYGAAEGRWTCDRFHTGYYVERYPDVAGHPRPALAHFLERGLAEGRAGMRLDVVPEPDLVAWSAAHDPAEARRVLVVDHRMLTPDRDAGSVRMIALVRILRELGREVTFASDSAARHFTEGEAAVAGTGARILYGHEEVRTHLVAEGHRYGTVILSRPEVARRYLPLVRGHALWARVVYDTVDLHWVRNQRAFELSGDPAAREAAVRYRALELLVVGAADVTLAITEDERATVLREDPAARVEVLPMIHQGRGLSPVPWERRAGIMFIGGYQHPPNVDAVEWFVAEVLPRIRARRPEVVFHAVGADTPERIRRLEGSGVRIEGFVPDPAPLFRSCRAFVAPLRFGAGMKGKIGQAMEFGLPVVTTPIGAEGMELVDGRHVLIAAAPEAFAEAVLRLHDDAALCDRLARTAAAHLEERFSPAAMQGRVLRWLHPAAEAAPGGER
jgi:hypothetical protein